MTIEIIGKYIDPQLVIIIPMLWGIETAFVRMKISQRISAFVLIFISCFMVVLHILSQETMFAPQHIPMCIFSSFTQGSILYLVSHITYKKIIKRGNNNE